MHFHITFNNMELIAFFYEMQCGAIECGRALQKAVPGAGMG
jgi:hypothetical protein